MGMVSFACYRPIPGKEEQLSQLMEEHVPILRGEGLVTDRVPVIVRSKDGTVIEVFEWNSAEAIAEAHSNQTVHALWARFNEACTYVKLSELPESADMFANFTPLED